MGFLILHIDATLMPGLQREVTEISSSFLIRIHEEYINLDKNTAGAAEQYFNRGRDYYVANYCLKSIHDLSISISLGNTKPEVYYYRALAKIDIKQFKEAKEDLDKVIELQQDSYLAYNKRGCVMYRLGNLDEAILDLDKSIKINPDFAESYCNKGYIKFKADEKEQALDNLNLAVKLNSKYLQAYFLLGIVNFDLNDYRKAILAYKKCIRLNTDDFDKKEVKHLDYDIFANMGLGRAYYKIAKFDDALNCFRKVVKRKKDWWLPVNHGIKAFKATINPENPPDLNADTSKRIALIVGNGNYAINALGKVPLNDVDMMVDILRRVDFEHENITVLKNANKAQFDEAFEAFLTKAKTMKADVALVHFSGHGVEISKVQYWLPIENEQEASEQALISVDDVLHKMQQADVPFKVIFSDACRNNNFHDTEGNLKRAYQETRGKTTGVTGTVYESAKTQNSDITNDAGSFLCFSTNAGNYANNEYAQTGNSAFVLAMRSKLRKGADIQLLMQDVANEVYNKTKVEATQNSWQQKVIQKPQIHCTPLQGFEF